MFYSRKKDDPTYPILDNSRTCENDYPFWEDVQWNDDEIGWNLFLPEGLSEFVAAFQEVPRFLLSWLRKLPAPTTKHIGRAKKEIFAITNEKKISLLEKARQQFSLIGGRLKEQAASPEFWLGVTCGVITRITTKIAITSVFAGHKWSAEVAGFAACAGAGLAAGVVVYLVRVCYRNFHVVPGGKKEKYLSRYLLESAVIGLFGGIIGGCVTNTGAIIARAGSFTIGTATGVTAGVMHAGIKGYFSSRRNSSDIGWRKLFVQGAAFGAVGGVLGVVSADLFAAHGSVAANVPVGQSGDVIYLPPSQPSPYMSDACGVYSCGAPHIISPPALVAAPMAPIQTVVVGQPQTSILIIETQVHHAPHHALMHAHHHHHPAKQTSQPPNPIKHIARHVTHRRHLAPPELQPPVIIEYMRPLMPPPPPPPLIIVPIVGPPPPPAYVAPTRPVDPCASGLCGAPCESSTQLDIRGPCADPGSHCVERVSFNENGDATKVVLESGTGGKTTPHFEVSAPVTDGPYWNKVAEGAPSSVTDSGKPNVSLVVPFTQPVLASLASAAPTPA